MLVKMSAEMCLLSKIANLRFCFSHKYFYNLYSSGRINLVIAIVMIINNKFCFTQILPVIISKCVSEDCKKMNTKFTRKKLIENCFHKICFLGTFFFHRII